MALNRKRKLKPEDVNIYRKQLKKKEQKGILLTSNKMSFE